MQHHVEALEPRLLFDAGDLDPTYGSAGKATIPTGFNDPYYLQSGDRVLVWPSLERLRADGSPDTNFAGASLLQQSPRGLNDQEAICVLPDDRIVIGGGTSDGKAELVFLTASGKIDRAHGKNGSIILPTTDPFQSDPTGPSISTITAAADGTLFVAGTMGLNDVSDAFVIKLAPSGRIDKTFAAGGVFIEPARVTDQDIANFFPEKILLRSDGEILVVGQGSHDDLGVPDFAPELILLTANGQPDSSFSDLSDANFINDSVLLSDGSLVTVELRNEEDFLAKVDMNGNAATGFGTDGAIDLGADDLGQSGLALQSDGKLLVRAAAKLSRYDASGDTDPTFGTNGSESTTDTLLGIGTDGTIFQQGPPNNDSVYVTRRFAEEGPAGLLSAKSLSTSTNLPYKFSVEWRDDDGIDVASLLNGLQIVGPDGSTFKAHLLGTIADGNQAIVGIYKFAAPAGSRNREDDGPYTIQVRQAKVKDINGVATTARVLGRFVVSI